MLQLTAEWLHGDAPWLDVVVIIDTDSKPQRRQDVHNTVTLTSTPILQAPEKTSAQEKLPYFDSPGNSKISPLTSGMGSAASSPTRNFGPWRSPRHSTCSRSNASQCIPPSHGKQRIYSKACREAEDQKKETVSTSRRITLI